VSDGFDGVKASVDAANKSLDQMASLLGRIADGVAPLPPVVDAVKKAADDLAAATKKAGEQSKAAFLDSFGLDGLKAAYDKLGHAVDLVRDKNNTLFGRMLAGAAVVGQFTTHVVAAGEALAQSAMRGEDHAEALAALGSAYQLVRAATNDTVSAEQALRVQQQLTQSGLRVSGEELAAITQKAREYAQANQIDVGQALAQVTDALRTGSKEGLQRYGIELTQSSNRANGFHRTMDGLRRSLASTTPEARSLGEEHARLSRSIGEAVDRFALAIAKLIRLKEVMESAGAAASELSDLVSGNGPGATTGQSAATSAQHEASRHLYGAAADDARRRFGVDANAALRSGRISTADQGRVAQELLRAGSADEARAVLARAMGARDQRIASASAAESTARAAERISAGAGGYGGGGAANDNAQQEAAAHLLAKREAYAAQLAEEKYALAESIRLKREADRQMAEIAFAAQRREERILRENTRLKDEAAQHERRLAEEYRQFQEKRHSFSAQGSEAIKAALGTEVTMAENAKEGVQAAVGAMTGAFRQHYAAVLTGQETLGQALKGMLQDTLIAISTEAAVKAIFAGAQALYFAAIGNYPGAASAAGSAAMFAVVAGAAGAGAYGLSQLDKKPSAGGGLASGTSSSGASSSGPTSAGSPSSSMGGGGNTYVFNVNGSATREDSEDALVRALDSAAQRGVMPRAQRAAA
jgi:hypothetical protein